MSATQIKGYILAALAAAFYGVNPAFAVPLYHDGMTAMSVLLFRYMLGLPVLFVCIKIEDEGFGLRRDEILPIAALGAVMAISSLALYEAYNYMNPGVASTLLFMYPILTALLMTIFFHEKFRFVTAICLAIMSVGLYFLMVSPDGVSLDSTGLGLTILAALTYAVYLVMVKVWHVVKLVPTLKSLFYQLLAGSLMFLTIVTATDTLVLPHGVQAWLCIIGLAMLPTVFSLLFTMKAIDYIGPTPTAIFGALDPVTAVILSAAVLGETMTMREIMGGSLIIVATLLEIMPAKS